MSDIVWNYDRAASGHRLRAWVDRFELRAYEDGRWEVFLSADPYSVAAFGRGESTQEAAQSRCLRVMEAMA